MPTSHITFGNLVISNITHFSPVRISPRVIRYQEETRCRKILSDIHLRTGCSTTSTSQPPASWRGLLPTGHFVRTSAMCPPAFTVCYVVSFVHRRQSLDATYLPWRDEQLLDLATLEVMGRLDVDLQEGHHKVQGQHSEARLTSSFMASSIEMTCLAVISSPSSTWTFHTLASVIVSIFVDSP